MSTTDYIINAILVLLVIRQIRGGKLDVINLVLPVVLVAGAAAYYLRSVPTTGNDVMLDVVLGLAGLVLGGLCGLTTRIRLVGGTVTARAGWIAAILWIVGIGARMGFAFSSNHGGGPAIERFSIAHSITGTDAWVAAFVMMALAEVITRLVVIRVRGRMVARSSVAEAAPSQVAA
jgi:hypothetical protein